MTSRSTSWRQLVLALSRDRVLPSGTCYTHVECKMLLEISIKLFHVIFRIHLGMALGKLLHIKCYGTKKFKVINVKSDLQIPSLWILSCSNELVGRTG
jgi:hypothetical protein